MEKKKEKDKEPVKSETKKVKRKMVSDIIQKIADVHATVDQGLAEMSSSCVERECKGE